MRQMQVDGRHLKPERIRSNTKEEAVGSHLKFLMAQSAVLMLTTFMQHMTSA